MGLDACRRDEGIRGVGEVEEEGMAGGQEEYVEVVWTSGGLGRGRKNYFVAGVFPVDKGNCTVFSGLGPKVRGRYFRHGARIFLCTMVQESRVFLCTIVQEYFFAQWCKSEESTFH